MLLRCLSPSTRCGPGLTSSPLEPCCPYSVEPHTTTPDFDKFCPILEF
uniref:Uncharacterized protein n=1 Tax=Cryptosporidium parvum TaxID=5807 RepID=F0X5K2_CRYPV